MKLEITYKKYVIALLAAASLFVAIVAFYSNAGAATNDSFRFDMVKAVESLSFLFGWISGLPNMLAFFLGCLILLLPSSIVFNWVIKKLEKNEKTN